MGTQAVRQRDRSSFKELAEMAATPPPSSNAYNLPSGPLSGPISSGPSSSHMPASGAPSSRNPNDSGLVDLQMVAAADPHGAERSKTTPLASAGLFDEEPGSIPPSSMQAHSQMVADAVPVSGHMPISGMRPIAHPDVIITTVPSSRPLAVAALQGVQGEKKKSGGLVIVLGGLATIAAMAAGVAVFVKMKGNPLSSKPVAVAVQAPTALTAPPAAPVVAADPPIVADPVAATADPAPESLPVGKLAVAPKQIVASKGGGKSAKPSAPEKPVAAQEKTPPAAPNSTASGDLKGAMQNAAGPEEKQVQAAAPTGPQFAPGMVPQKPSQGAVAGAIGAVLQNARQCLGPDDPISKALVIFGSSGAVSTVTVTGHAAGTPSEACIKTAFSKAKVSPFAETTYSANVTVRPLAGQ